VNIEAVVMTCLEPWVVDAINSVNSQEKPFDEKHLLIDESFLDDDGKTFLKSMETILSGWKIHVHLLNNDFAFHRNWMLKQLPKNGEWVFFIDADETFGKHFVSTAKSMIEYSDRHSKNKVDAYAVPRINFFEGRGVAPDIDWANVEGSNYLFNYPDWAIRLLKNNENTEFVGMVHEVLINYNTVVANLDPKMVVFHLKDWKMQDVSNKRWRKLEALRREKDPGYLSHIQGEDWERFIREFED
jgi:hypothetical protein